MILSNCEIHKAIDEGKLVIDPEPLPRRPTLGEIFCPYNTHSVDLKLHEQIRVPESGSFTIDLTRPGSLAEQITKNSEEHILREKQPYTLEKHEFVLARTLERIELPIVKGPPYLGTRIEGKSSRSRCGLLVHFTAPTVHPGFEGTLTLEIINLGPAAFLLYPKMYIAQLIIKEVKGEITPNPSQFQGQSTPEGT